MQLLAVDDGCVRRAIAEDLTGEQTYDFLFERASALFCSINWAESSSFMFKE